MDVNEARKLRALEDENARMKRNKQRRTRRVRENEVKRLSASCRKDVWSWDFVHDQTVRGSSFRILSVLDEYSKECHSLQPRRSYRAENVIEVLDELIEEHGASRFIRSDNGPEFIAYAV